MVPILKMDDPSTWFFLILAVGLALSFEFVNGFHDTANAVANEDGRLLPRQVEIAKCSAHHRRAGSKHAQIVGVPAVRDEVAVDSSH